MPVLGASLQEALDPLPDERQRTRDARGHPSRPVALLIPRQQVAGQRKAQDDEQEQHAEDPVEFAGATVGPVEEDLDDVQRTQDHHGARPEVVDAAHDSAESDAVL